MRVAAVLLALAAGCGGDGGTNVGDAGTSSDASSSGDASSLHGLLVTWTANPALPGTLKTDLTVTSATFHIARLQVIGDNGQPMTTSPFAISWKIEGGGDPGIVAFPSAPSGLYSQVTLHIDEPLLNTSYEITGTAKVGGVTRTFQIHDRNSLNIDVKDFNVSLAPGGDATVPIRLDLKDAIDSIQFDQLNEENGVLELDTTDPQMENFREKLEQAFKKGP
ncbi:MAG: hypothetical protein IPQ07_32710 [Myxococcales bacterium]|nr:hypothetical protein [Myxococcales bacterium]